MSFGKPRAVPARRSSRQRGSSSESQKHLDPAQGALFLERAVLAPGSRRSPRYAAPPSPGSCDHLCEGDRRCSAVLSRNATPSPREVLPVWCAREAIVPLVTSRSREGEARQLALPAQTPGVKPRGARGRYVDERKRHPHPAPLPAARQSRGAARSHHNGTQRRGSNVRQVVHASHIELQRSAGGVRPSAITAAKRGAPRLYPVGLKSRRSRSAPGHDGKAVIQREAGQDSFCPVT